jgi:hypothetical protein
VGNVESERLESSQRRISSAAAAPQHHSKQQTTTTFIDLNSLHPWIPQHYECNKSLTSSLLTAIR